MRWMAAFLRAQRDPYLVQRRVNPSGVK
jgi:hypothetical protein